MEGVDMFWKMKAERTVTTDVGGVFEGAPTKPADPVVKNEINSGCPGGGGVSDGICKPFTNDHRSTWMSTYEGCRYLRIDDAILPGTHNAGMDKEAAYGNSLETCQDVSPYKQLMTGVRVLDLRVQFSSANSPGDPQRFRIFHDLQSGRTVEGDVLAAVLSFREHSPLEGNPKQEIIILDFHGFKDFNDAAHRELAEIIKGKLGAIIIDPWMSALTINQIWQFGDFGVVVTYNADPRDSRFWYRLNQRWIGRNTPSTDELKDFMNEVADEVKPYGELRSIQCAKYNKVFFTPDDFSDKIREWFASEYSASYIQDFYVIYTDWSLRQRLIDNCIHANVKRLPNRAPYKDCYVDQSDAELKIESGHRSVNIRIVSGHGTLVILLPQTADDGATIVIKSAATQTSEVIIGNTGSPADRVPMERGEVVAFNYTSSTQKWEMLHKTSVPIPPPLPAPQNFKVDNENTRSIDMSWDPVPGTSWYSVWHQVPLALTPRHVGNTSQTLYRESLGYLPPLDRGARWVKAVDENGTQSKASNLAYYDRKSRFRFW